MNKFLKYVVIVVVAFFIQSCGTKRTTVRKPSSKTTQPKQKSNTVKAGVKKRNLTTVDYINEFADIAMLEMKKYGIPASITLAQGILESGNGNGRLAREANNHFGIKCHGWKGQKIYHDDDKSQECFRKYKEALTSYEDHSKFLTGRKRYASLFKLKKNNYKAWAKGLKAAGYATDKKYPQKLISLIERYELYTYDSKVLGKKVKIKEKPLKQVRVNSGVYLHTVIKGDTLYSLSKKFNTTVKAIKELNNLDDNTLTIGQELKIPN